MSDIGNAPATKQVFLTDGGDDTAVTTITKVVNPALAGQGPWFRVGLRSRGIIPPPSLVPILRRKFYVRHWLKKGAGNRSPSLSP